MPIRVRTDLFDASNLSELMKKGERQDHAINLRDDYEYEEDIDRPRSGFRGLGPNVFCQAVGSLRLNLHEKKWVTQYHWLSLCIYMERERERVYCSSVHALVFFFFLLS